MALALISFRSNVAMTLSSDTGTVAAYIVRCHYVSITFPNKQKAPYSAKDAGMELETLD